MRDNQMFELFKVGWDLFTIRHYSRQGMKLSAGDYIVAIGFVVFLYATAVPAAVLFQNHPQYKWVLIATLAIDGIVAIAMFVWEVKWWIKHRAAALAARSAQPSAPSNQPGR
jgi:hypothetical protein